MWMKVLITALTVFSKEDSPLTVLAKDDEKFVSVFSLWYGPWSREEKRIIKKEDATCETASRELSY